LNHFFALQLIRSRYAAHRELDLSVGQLPPMFNCSHVAARRKFSKKFSRFGARIVERERESFAKKAV